MGVILNLPKNKQHLHSTPKTTKKVSDFEIIIFPGVRYDRGQEAAFDHYNGKKQIEEKTSV